MASGDLEENQIAELTAAGAPIDSFGVGTDLGTSRDSPVVNGIYKLVAHQVGGAWQDVRKRSPEKATVPGAKQVFRDYADGEMRGDVIARAEEVLPGRPLLVPFVRNGVLVREETIEQMSERARAELEALPPGCESSTARARVIRSPTPIAAARRFRRSTLAWSSATITEEAGRAPEGTMVSDASRQIAALSGAEHIPGVGRSADEHKRLATSGFGSARLLLAAEHAVDIGARILRQGRSHIGALIGKGDRDFATDVDLHIESEIKASLAEATPEIPFLGEEGGGAQERAEEPAGCLTRSMARSTSRGTVRCARSRCRW